jgi:hypothetical protein
MVIKVNPETLKDYPIVKCPRCKWIGQLPDHMYCLKCSTDLVPWEQYMVKNVRKP